MSGIVKSDEQAFEELYRRYADKLFRYFYRMLGQNEEKANDFTQELFLKIVEKPHYFNPKYHFSTWIYTVATNMCKNEYRRLGNRPSITYELPELKAPENLSHFSSNLDKQLFEQYLQRALEELDEIPRQCFILRYQEEKSIKEISAILGCPEGTVKSRLFYTIKKLSKKLSVFSND